MSDDRPTHLDADGTLRPYTDAEMAQRQADADARADALAARPRQATGTQLLAVMTASQTAAWDKAVDTLGGSKRAYWFSHYADPIPETNRKIVALAGQAGLDLKALYDAAPSAT